MESRQPWVSALQDDTLCMLCTHLTSHCIWTPVIILSNRNAHKCSGRSTDPFNQIILHFMAYEIMFMIFQAANWHSCLFNTVIQYVFNMHKENVHASCSLIQIKIFFCCSFSSFRSFLERSCGGYWQRGRYYLRRLQKYAACCCTASFAE